jgi:hypothetical protein
METTNHRRLAALAERAAVEATAEVRVAVTVVVREQAEMCQ